MSPTYSNLISYLAGLAAVALGCGYLLFTRPPRRSGDAMRRETRDADNRH